MNISFETAYCRKAIRPLAALYVLDYRLARIRERLF